MFKVTEFKMMQTLVSQGWLAHLLFPPQSPISDLIASERRPSKDTLRQWDSIQGILGLKYLTLPSSVHVRSRHSFLWINLANALVCSKFTFVDTVLWSPAPPPQHHHHHHKNQMVAPLNLDENHIKGVIMFAVGM